MFVVVFDLCCVVVCSVFGVMRVVDVVCVCMCVFIVVSVAVAH